MIDLTEFKNYLAINGANQKTISNYVNQMASYFKQHSEFNQESINKYLANKVTYLSNGSYNMVIKSMKKFNLYVKANLELPKLKKVERKVRPYIQEDEIIDILSKCHVIFDDYTKVICIVKLLFFSGMRPKELVNLKREDINLDKQEIIVKNTKTFKARKIFIPQDVVVTIKAVFGNEPEKTNAFNTTEANVYYYFKKINETFKPSVKLYPYLGRHCVSSDTEILTEMGWKKWNELKNLKIFTINPITQKCEILPIKNVHSYNYNGELYSINNKNIDLIATPEHTMFTSIFTTKSTNNIEKYVALPYQLTTLNKILNYPNLYYAKTLLTTQTSQKKSINNSLAFILGVLLTDGNIHKQRNSYSITISQSLSANFNKCELIEYHLQNSGLIFTKNIQKEKINSYNKKLYQMVIYRILTVSHNIIFKYLNADNSPKIKLILLSYKNLKSIFDGLMLGDGCRGKEFCDQNLKNIEFIQIIGTLININVRMSFNTKYRTYINSVKITYNIKKKDIKKISYKGIVWCPETENGTWIARRNNKIFVSGNSFSRMFLKKTNNDLVALSQTLGHNSLATTQIYSEKSDEERKEQINKIFK